ncbi:MAG TPA: impB/mucB/samB family protein [Alphaproteobacteria bacterium]|nr:impB/mucB/samB family protein [Alphaproteobacteria bacterium]
MPQPPINIDKTNSDLRWIYVDFNSYFASVEQQLNPKLRGKPVAVVPVETDATCAIAASYEAKAFGIKTGTPIYEVKKICPGLICILAQHEKYIEFHNRIKEEVEKHIPVSAVCSIDEVACKLMDNESSEEVATKIALSIKKGLAKNVGEFVKCSIGIAPNKYLAKLATELQKPDGLVILHKHDLPDKLLKLKLRDFPGIGYSMEKRLIKAGVKNFADIWAMSAKQMRKVWGSIWGDRMWYLLRGIDLPEEVTKKRSIGHSHVMSPELRSPDKAKFVARRLTLKVASRLKRLGYYASALHFSTRLESGQRLEGSMKCIKAQDSITLTQMLNEIWKALKPQMKGQKLKKVSVTAYELSEANSGQPELFDPLPAELSKKRKKQESISNAIDRINHKYGRDSILLGMLPTQGRSFTGTKIAFTRIPDMEEFLE